MLTSLLNVESAFQKVKLFSILFMLLCAGAVIIMHLHYSQLQDRLLSRAENPYLLVGNEIHQIKMVTDLSKTRPIEARGHIERFHELYFNLDPDDEIIDNNIGKALYLVDESGRLQYEHQQNNRYFSQLITDNISQRIRLNKPVELDTINGRVSFRLEATQYLTRSTSIVKRSLITTGYLRDHVGRTENNRHGFLIEDWTILENLDQELIKR